MGELIITIKRHIYIYIITFLRSDPRPDILFLTFFRHSIWYISGHSIWHFVWHSIWHIFYNILSGIWHIFWHDILSGTARWIEFVHLSGILSAICLVFSVMCSGPGVPSCIQSWRRRRRWEGGDEEKEEAEEEEGVAPLKKKQRSSPGRWGKTR